MPSARILFYAVFSIALCPTASAQDQGSADLNMNSTVGEFREAFNSDETRSQAVGVMRAVVAKLVEVARDQSAVFIRPREDETRDEFYARQAAFGAWLQRSFGRLDEPNPTDRIIRNNVTLGYAICAYHRDTKFARALIDYTYMNYTGERDAIQN